MFQQLISQLYSHSFTVKEYYGMTYYEKILCKYILDDCDMLLYFTNLRNIKIHSVTLIYFK